MAGNQDCKARANDPIKCQGASYAIARPMPRGRNLFFAQTVTAGWVGGPRQRERGYGKPLSKNAVFLETFHQMLQQKYQLPIWCLTDVCRIPPHTPPDGYS